MARTMADTATEKFFKENSEPTAWNPTKGLHVSFAVARDIYSRDKEIIARMAKLHKLVVSDVKGRSFVGFSK